MTIVGERKRACIADQKNVILIKPRSGDASEAQRAKRAWFDHGGDEQKKAHNPIMGDQYVRERLGE